MKIVNNSKNEINHLIKLESRNYIYQKIVSSI